MAVGAGGYQGAVAGKAQSLSEWMGRYADGDGIVFAAEPNGCVGSFGY